MGRVVLRYILPMLLVAAAGVVASALINTPPMAERSGQIATAPVVGVVDLKPITTPVHVEAFGTVVAAQQVQIQPQSSGRIVSLHPDLVPGGLIPKGAILFEIDPADYKIAVAQAEANRDVAALEIDRLNAAVEALTKDAKKIEVELDYLQWDADRLVRLSGNDTAGEAETRDARSQVESQEAALAALQARILEQKKGVAGAVAGLAAKESDLAAAKLAMARTVIRAPFDAIVTEESVELGQFVGSQTSVATLVATDVFWVEAAVPIAHLPSIRFENEFAGANGTEPKPNVRVTLADGTESAKRIVHQGYALRPLAELDAQGRMARVLIAIRNPFDLQTDGRPGNNRMLLGSYVRLEIDIGVLEDVLSIPRRAVRENDRIWVRDAGGTLQIRTANVIWRRDEDILVKGGFEKGDLVVTTRLTNIVPGMPLDIRSESSTPPAPADAAPADSDESTP